MQLQAPDFLCTSPELAFTVEATTVAPSTMGPLAEHPNPKTQADIADFLRDYMPMKHGSALVSNLRKTNSADLHYWEREESPGKPFLIAIADFHKPADRDMLGSMTYTQSALWVYLYGQRVHWTFDENGQLIVRAEEVGEHRYGEKVVPSGFFDDPLAESVSAVLFSNAGTLAKFDRMGIVAGFRVAGDHYMRIVVKVDPDPNAAVGIAFSADVMAPGYEEFWTEEIQVFHNPNARYPLPFEALLGATHHFIKDGRMRSWGPLGSILRSYSFIIRPRAGDKADDA